MSHTVRIVPAPKTDDGPMVTQGTKFFVGDQEIQGVYKVEIFAECNDVWRAVLHLTIVPPEIEAEARIVEEMEITDLGDYVRRYAAKFCEK